MVGGVGVTPTLGEGDENEVNFAVLSVGLMRDGHDRLVHGHFDSVEFLTH